MRRTLGAAVLAVLPAAALAQTPELMRGSLKGVGEISVVVQLRADARSKDKLREEDRNSLVILGRVERKLRRGGMAANPHIFQDPHPSVLEVDLDVHCPEPIPACAVGIGLRFNQRARVNRSSVETIAVTWHAEQMTALPLDRMAEAFAGLDTLLDRLVADFQAANKTSSPAR